MAEQDVFYAILEFAATFFGVLLAFGLTLWYDRKKKREQEEANLTRLLQASLYDRKKKREQEESIRIRVLQAIELELRENLKQITPESVDGITEGDRRAFLVAIATAAFDSAVNSGHFTLLDAETQTEVAKIYRDFEYADMWRDKVLSMIGSADMAMTSAKKNLEEFKNWLSKTQEGLRKNIPKVIALLHSKRGMKS